MEELHKPPGVKIKLSVPKMASSHNDTDAAASSVDHGDVVVGNLQRLRSNESFNDVQFSLRDGTVHANSVILSMSSDYFATMISNEKDRPSIL